MENKMTAVEWLEKNISLDMNPFELIKYFNKAKEMEKKQSIDFARHCLHKANREFDLGILTSFIDVHQYYKEEYGK